MHNLEALKRRRIKNFWKSLASSNFTIFPWRLNFPAFQLAPRWQEINYNEKILREAKRAQIQLVAVIHATWGRTVTACAGKPFRSSKNTHKMKFSLCKFFSANLSTLRKTEKHFLQSFIKLENCNFQLKNRKASEIVWSKHLEHLVKGRAHCFLWQHLALHNLVVSVFLMICFEGIDEKKTIIEKIECGKSIRSSKYLLQFNSFESDMQEWRFPRCRRISTK